jgi:DNA-binding transcriptional LysR family regulator
MELELRHLRIVVAVAEAGSVTKAAAHLGLAQPAVTAQLRRIERSLGGELFERGRQGVTPTALGELVLGRARVLLPAARELQDDALRLAASTRGSVAVASELRIGTTGSPYLAGIVRLLERAEPDTQVVTSASFRSLELLDQVRSARIDCAAIGCCGEHGLPTDPDLDVRTVGVDPVWVMLPENHPAAQHGGEVRLADVADMNWAWLPGDGCLYECFVAACMREGFSPRTGYETDAATCVDMARTGRAAALCMPTRSAAGVVVRPLARAPLRWVHAIVWRDDPAVQNQVDAVMPLAAAAYADVVAEWPEYSSWLSSHPSFGPAAHRSFGAATVSAVR